MNTRQVLLAAIIAGLGAVSGAGLASAQDVPAGYPAGYGDIIQTAKAEGTVTVYSPTAPDEAQGFVDAFEAAFPGIQVNWTSVSSAGVYSRVSSESAAGQVGGDVVWADSLDLLMLLAEEGYVEPYLSPEAGHFPDWAKYKDSVYLTTVEPSVFMYNKTLFTGEPPKSHDELLTLLTDRKNEISGKVTTFDPETTGQAYGTFSKDNLEFPKFWDLINAFGAADGKAYSNSGQIREKITSGEHWLGFNVNGAYAKGWVAKSPNLAVIYPLDYTIAVSRGVLAVKGAPHPNAAKLVLDFMLSKAGQESLSKAGLPALRTDTENVDNFDTINKLAGGNLKPMALNEDLLKGLEPTVRAEFFNKWKAALSK